ncbi:hypothetical protein BJY04DRAFT_213775 [Aspergillus karnatakaensis]|uniref:uncharacterized protein n=1 Tax=Aspergillus karnatakaensis TaxID=1810916 RepID=UPI003CCCBD54
MRAFNCSLPGTRLDSSYLFYYAYVDWLSGGSLARSFLAPRLIEIAPLSTFERTLRPPLHRNGKGHAVHPLAVFETGHRPILEAHFQDAATISIEAIHMAGDEGLHHQLAADPTEDHRRLDVEGIDETTRVAGGTHLVRDTLGLLVGRESRLRIRRGARTALTMPIAGFPIVLLHVTRLER